MAKAKKRPSVVAFTCHWGGFPLLGGAAIDSSVDLRLVRLMCGGRVSVGLILRAFEKGADGVVVVACDEGDCHYGFGSGKGAEEFQLAKKISRILGIEDERLAYCAVQPGDVEKARNDVKQFVKGVKKVGKSNVRIEEV